jgi:hypothetical protein
VELGRYLVLDVLGDELLRKEKVEIAVWSERHGYTGEERGVEGCNLE